MSSAEARTCYEQLEDLHLRLIDMYEAGRCSEHMVLEANRKTEEAFIRWMKLKEKEERDEQPAMAETEYAGR